MNILDLFSGIGGFTLAAMRSGFEIEKHYASEIDKYAQMIYRRNFNGSVQLGDVTGIGNELGKIDIITGGFPCQAFSIAGKRRGFEDTRGTLFFEIERLCRLYRPSYMVLENVKGLASHEGGDTIRVILDKLRRLDYSVQLLLLNTKDFGIPQNRERFFFICTARGKRQPEISGIRERQTETAFSANCLDANYYKGIDNHGQRRCVAIHENQRKEVREMDIHPTLSSSGGGKAGQGFPCVKVGTLRTHKDGEGFREMQSGLCPTIPARAREDGSGQPMIIVPANGRFRKENQYPDVVPCLSPGAQSKNSDNNPVLSIPVLSPDRINKYQNGRRFKEDGEPFFTLTAQDRHGVYNGEIIRRLTPVECERLQDYPDNWTKRGEDKTGKEVEISDTQRYKTCGNSITVKVAEEIFKEIRKVYNERR